MPRPIATLQNAGACPIEWLGLLAYDFKLVQLLCRSANPVETNLRAVAFTNLVTAGKYNQAFHMAQRIRIFEKVLCANLKGVGLSGPRDDLASSKIRLKPQLRL